MELFPPKIPHNKLACTVCVGLTALEKMITKLAIETDSLTIQKKFAEAEKKRKLLNSIDYRRCLASRKHMEDLRLRGE